MPTCREGSVALNFSSAVAMDGGSLWLEIGENDQREGFLLDRSFEVRGTSEFERICTSLGSLPDAKMVVLADEKLDGLLAKVLAIRDTLAPEDPNAYVVREFVTVLERRLSAKGR